LGALTPPAHGSNYSITPITAPSNAQPTQASPPAHYISGPDNMKYKPTNVNSNITSATPNPTAYQAQITDNSAPNTDKLVARQFSSNSNYVDITPYLNLPQKQAAQRLGIPTSTLSKRWKEAVCGRKWPYRCVCKLDKEILTLLQNIQPGEPLSPEIEEALAKLLKRRKEELRSVIIRI